MRIRGQLLLTLIGSLATVSVLGAADGPGVFSIEPPDVVRADLSLLREGKADERVLERVGSCDVAAPYLRRELIVLVGRAKRDAERSLKVIEDRIIARNVVRATRWVRDGRFDLYTEFVSGCADADAIPLVDLGMRSWSLMQENAADINARKLLPGQLLLDRFRGRVGFPHLTGEQLTVDAGLLEKGLVRTGRCQFDTWERDACVVLVRGTLTDPITPQKPNGSIGFWYRSVVIVNNVMQLGQCQYSLILADGDIELQNTVFDSIVVANGNIMRGDVRNGVAPTHRSIIAATGDIQSIGDAGSNLFHAGGVCHTKVGHTSGVREKQRSLPFGIRFLDPTEFGLTLAAQNGGVQIIGMVNGSVFARHGVDDADVILSVDDKAVETVPEFRRALRRGIIQESVTLRIKRGTSRLTRIVFLDDVPVPTAPPPRPKS